MGRDGRAAPLGAALLSLAAGCSSVRTLSQDDLLAQGQVVHEGRPGAARAERLPGSTAADAEAAADRAESLLDAGEEAEALVVIREALAARPPEGPAARLRALRIRARREFLQDAVARASIEVSPARMTEGTPLRVRVVLRNLSPVPLVVRRAPGGTSPTTARISIRRRAVDVYGNVRTDSWEESLPVPPGEAPPGGTLAAETVFLTERFRPLFPRGFVEYSFGGTLLPSALAAGEVAVHERIPLDEASAFAFPAKWEEVAADPGRAIDRGLEARNPVRLLVAAACTDPAGRAAAGARLAALLGGEPPLSPAMDAGVRAALRVLGGDDAADDWPASEWDRRLAALSPGEAR